MATQNFETLRARVQALGDIPALRKPFTVEGTKLRLPKEIGDSLQDLEPRLRKLLDECHYEGVQYDYQDEEPDASERATVVTPLTSKQRVNVEFAERVGNNIDEALRCIERARRLADVCASSVKAMQCENSYDIALTMGNELFEALDDARKALEGKA